MKIGLTLSYDSAAANDGTGAQLQRIFGIFAIATLPGIQYLHSGIQNLIIHPLDPFQSDLELSKYLETVNQKFSLPSSLDLPKSYKRVYKVNQLTFWRFAYFALRALMSRKTILLQIKNPYRVIEKFPTKYRHVRTHFSFVDSRENNSSKEKTIVLHVRRGTNGADTLPGELSPRMLSDSYYFTLVKEILEKYCKKDDPIELVIITDVPKEDFVYNPIASQLEFWSTEPRFRDGSITMQGRSFSDFNFESLARLSVIHGGDPIVALETMRSADFLVMSRSSFSYIGAILNTCGVVFYPPAFWHKPMPEWAQVK
jgi:hypothetical protein